MRAGKGSSDAYLADWARSDPRPCGDDLQAEASAEAARLEERFTDEDLERLIRAKGLDEGDGVLRNAIGASVTSTLGMRAKRGQVAKAGKRKGIVLWRAAAH